MGMGRYGALLETCAAVIRARVRHSGERAYYVVTGWGRLCTGLDFVSEVRKLDSGREGSRKSSFVIPLAVRLPVGFTVRTRIPKTSRRYS